MSLFPRKKKNKTCFTGMFPPEEEITIHLQTPSVVGVLCKFSGLFLEAFKDCPQDWSPLALLVAHRLGGVGCHVLGSHLVWVVISYDR